MRARIPVLGALLCSALVAACVTGADLDRLPSARNPNGARASIGLRSGGTRSVELVSTNEGSLLVMHNDSVKTVGWSAVNRISVPGLDSWVQPFTERERSEILRASRFPYGVPADVMTTLLERSGQTAAARLE